MSEFTKDDGLGKFFPNTSKTGQQPDFTGFLEIDGQCKKVSVWNNGNYSSIKTRPMTLDEEKKHREDQAKFAARRSAQSQQSPAPMTPPSQGNPVDLDKEIPF
jgi:hypothetical protein